MTSRSEDDLPGRRWPAWVYRIGADPDPRWSFANERTFLAWIRTALALIAAGVALTAFETSMSPSIERTLSNVLIVLGFGCSLTAWLRWARGERAMRLGQPLVLTPFALFLALGVSFCALALVVALWR